MNKWDYITKIKELSTMYNDKINKNLQKLREFVKWAKSKRYPVHEDFFAFYPKLKETVKDVQYIEADELQNIIDLEIEKWSTMDVVRDLFVFQCFKFSCKLFNLLLEFRQSL